MVLLRMFQINGKWNFLNKIKSDLQGAMDDPIIINMIKLFDQK